EQGAAVPVPAVTATALQRALQEALSNARRHAPGLPASVTLDWRPGGVVLAVSNPVAPGTAPSPGGGFGLVGMRERFAALPHGGTVRAETAGVPATFTLTAEARL
ncbi:MAG TPA: ATP-binding protein, partial [Microbacterium sp.]|uniref:sensor histidine kinase n=1 Tax=Microbacterium sp. TaxID=51671 RepID=UPI002B48E4CF